MVTTGESLSHAGVSHSLFIHLFMQSPFDETRLSTALVRKEVPTGPEAGTWLGAHRPLTGYVTWDTLLGPSGPSFLTLNGG